MHVREIATGKDLPGVVRWFRFSGIAWTKDSKGFFYARFPEPPQGKALEADLKDHQVWYHRVGTAQDQDRLIYWRRELPRYFVGADVTDDGRYLIDQRCSTAPTRRTGCSTPTSAIRCIPTSARRSSRSSTRTSRELTVLGNEGPVFYVRTDLDAPNRRIIAIDPRQRTGRAGWKSVVPESRNALESATMAGEPAVLPVPGRREGGGEDLLARRQGRRRARSARHLERPGHERTRERRASCSTR